MNKYIKTSVLVLASAGALVACNQLLWQTTFTAEGAYATHGTVNAVGANESAFLGGYTDLDDGGLDARHGLIVKYNAQGNPEWNRVLDHNDGLVSFGVQALLPDAQGNVYVANTLFDEANARLLLSISKLDLLGATVWSWQGDTSGMLGLKRDMYFGADGNLYIKSGTMLQSLTPNGDIRFSINAPVSSEPPTHCLGWYLDSIERYDFEVINNSRNLLFVGLQNNYSGNISAHCLGFSELIDTEEINGDIFVLGRLSSQDLGVKVIRQTENSLALDNNVVGILPVTSTNTFISKHGQNGFCFASIDDQMKLSTGFIDTNLQVKWTNDRTLTGLPGKTHIGDVVNVNNVCYVQYVESYASDKITSVVLAENEDSGKQKAKINTDHVVVWDIAVGGKNVLQSGIKGSYTTDEGMAAYLSKSIVN